MTNNKPTRNALKIQLSLRGYNQTRIAKDFRLSKFDVAESLSAGEWSGMRSEISRVFLDILDMPITDQENYIPFTPDEIKQGLSDRGLTQADVGRYLKTERTMIYAVIKGDHKSGRIAAEIKRILTHEPGQDLIIEGYSREELHNRRQGK